MMQWVMYGAQMTLLAHNQPQAVRRPAPASTGVGRTRNPVYGKGARGASAAIFFSCWR